MNTDLLRSFVEVARQGSYTHAAKTLYLSQPTVYQHVRGLEQALGATLVTQIGKRVVLTAEGKVVMDQAIRVLSEVSQLLNSVLLDQHELRSGLIDVVVGTTFGQAILPLAIGEFRNRYPGISIRAPVFHEADQIDEAVLRFGYDAGYRSGSPPRAGLSTIPIIDDILVGIVPPRHPIVKNKRPLTASDISDQGVVTYARPFGLRQTIETWATSQGCILTISIELNSQAAMVAAVAAAGGVSVVSLLSAMPFMKAGLVTAVQLDPPISRPTFLIHRSGVELPLALVRLTEIVTMAASQTQADALQLVRY